MNDSQRVKRAQAMREAREDMAHTLESIVLVAELTRAKYLALLKQGFTEAQAIELCKTL